LALTALFGGIGPAFAQAPAPVPVLPFSPAAAAESAHAQETQKRRIPSPGAHRHAGTNATIAGNAAASGKRQRSSGMLVDHLPITTEPQKVESRIATLRG